MVADNPQVYMAPSQEHGESVRKESLQAGMTSAEGRLCLVHSLDITAFAQVQFGPGLPDE